MTKSEMRQFIDIMEEIGDDWEMEDVERVYGEESLEEALADRKSSVGMFFDGIAKILNR